MKIFKKITAAVCAVATVLSIAGCADVTKMGTIEDQEIKAGVYLWFANAAMDEAYDEINEQLEALGQSASKIENFNIFDYKVGEGDSAKTTSQYVEDRTMEFIKQHVAVQKEFEKQGLTITAEEKDEIKENTNNLWNSEITYYGYSTGVTYGENYENIGISKSSYEKVQLVNKMRNKLFDAYYETNGITETDEKDINVYFNDNYGRFQIIQVELTEGDGSKIETDEGKAAMKKLAQGYLDRLLKGEDYDTVYHDYEDYVAEQKKLAEDKKNESNSSASSSASSVVSSTASSSATTSNSSGATEEDEAAHDHDFLLGVKDTQPSEEFIEWAFKLKDDEGKIYEDEKAGIYFVVLRKNLDERKDWFEKYRSDILHEMKDDEFDDLLNELAKDYKVNFTEDAINAYKPENIKR